MDRHDDDWPVHRKVHGAASVRDGVRPHPVRISDRPEVEVERGPARRRDEGRVLEISCDSQAQLAIRRRRLRLDEQHDELAARSARAVEARHRPRQLPRCCLLNDRRRPRRVARRQGKPDAIRRSGLRPGERRLQGRWPGLSVGHPHGVVVELRLQSDGDRCLAGGDRHIARGRGVQLARRRRGEGWVQGQPDQADEQEDRQDRDQHARALQEHDDGSPRVMEHGRPRP